MATLVLTAVGTLIGGPVGGAIGALAGQYVDHALIFKPKPREGPRLTELAVQTSSYGTPIPKLFGTMRVAGSVIWATDLQEHRSSSGGKGRPSTTSYSYTASFAVALSARPILTVGRIWADGKLLRGAAGDFKAHTRFRLHLGDEDQAADPLIASAEGAGLTPAHRGLAYAAFEDLDLTDFGNRIPSLTFEVTADAGPVAAGAIAEALSGGSIAAGEALQPLDGFSAWGNLRAVAEVLTDASGGWAAADGSLLRLRCGTGDARELADRGANTALGSGARAVRAIAAPDAVPRTVTLAHYDPARDWQAGVQRAVRPGAGWRERRIELPAAISADAAKALAASALARAEMERERRTLALGWDALDVSPGARVAIAGEPGQWRVVSATLEHMVVELELLRIAPGLVPTSAAGGRVTAAPDAVRGPTIVHAFELPPLDEGVPAVPRLLVAAAGAVPGWRSAALLLRADGASWAPIGGTAAPATLGVVTSPPAAAPATIEDRANQLDVTLAHAGMVLSDADPAQLRAGANLALVGEEMIQFGSALPLGGNAWRLSRLWRGRRGTEAAIGAHGAGERFVMLSAETLAATALPASAIGATVSLLASGVGDLDAPAEASAAISGASVVPPSPVHLTARATADGGVALTWVRRSRAGWGWIDGADAPLAEERERYRVTLLTAADAPRMLETDRPELLLAPADRPDGEFSIEVRQLGTHGASPAATLIVAGS